MATRTANQYRGDLGELAMTEMLLGFGMSVNSLTASDFGLDLHAFLPAGAPFAEADIEADSPPWEMTAVAAHFQVKNTTADAGVPSVKVSTLKNWVTASKNTPVFVLIAHIADSNSSRETYSYITPTGLKELLKTGKPGAKTRSVTYEDKRWGHSWHRRAFFARVHLWAVAPALMDAYEECLPLPDTYTSGRHDSKAATPIIDFDHRVVSVLIDLGHAYMHHFQVRSKAINPAEIKALVKELAEIYEGRQLNNGKPIGTWVVEQYVLDLIESRITQQLASTTPRVSTAAYTLSMNPREALRDLKNLVETLSRYQPYYNGTRLNPNDPSNYEGLKPQP